MRDERGNLWFATEAELHDWAHQQGLEVVTTVWMELVDPDSGEMTGVQFCCAKETRPWAN